MERRADQVLSEALELLENIRVDGLFHAIEEGLFAGIKRRRVGEKGLMVSSRKANAITIRSSICFWRSNRRSESDMKQQLPGQEGECVTPRRSAG